MRGGEDTTLEKLPVLKEKRIFKLLSNLVSQDIQTVEQKYE